MTDTRPTHSPDESHPDDIGLPAGPLHFGSASRAGYRFNDRELELLNLALSLLAQSPISTGPTAVEIATLRTRVLELAFMEVSRDA